MYIHRAKQTLYVYIDHIFFSRYYFFVIVIVDLYTIVVPN